MASCSTKKLVDANMGNFQQHKEWALYTIVIIQAIMIYLVIQQTIPIDFLSFDTAKGQIALFAVLLSIPFIFTIGAVSPDIDLPKDSWETRLFFQFFLPILFGFGIGIGVYRIITHGLSSVGFVSAELSNIASAPFIIAVGFGVVVAFLSFIFVYLLDKKSVHWGFCHSIGFSFVLSGIVFIALLGIWGSQYYLLVILQTLAYLTGYWNHLICDQVYHELRDKHWDNPRYALKIWSNSWNFDPFIVLDELTGGRAKEGHAKKKEVHHHTKSSN